MVRTISQQITPEEAHAQLHRMVEQLREPFPQVAVMLEDNGPDILAFTGFSVAHWQKLWSNNSLPAPEQGNPPPHRCGGNLSQSARGPATVSALLAGQHDAWAEARRYLKNPNGLCNEALPEPRVLQAAD